MQRPAAHIYHLLGFGQILLLVAGLKGIGQFNVKFNSTLFGSIQKCANQGHAVSIFQVMLEGQIRHHGGKTQLIVEDAAQSVRPKQGGIKLDGRVQLALGHEVVSDFFHFIRWAAVHGGNGDIVGHAIRNIQFCYTGVKIGQTPDLFRLFFGAIRHFVQEPLYGGAQDAFQVVPDAHIEDEACFSGCPPAELVLENVQHDPGVEVFVKRLIQLQLLGPFAVVPLVGHVDARFGHFQFVQYLYCFQLYITCPGQPGGDDILGKLGMRSGRHSQRGFQKLPIAAYPERVGWTWDEKEFFSNTKNLFLLFFFQNPLKQGLDVTTPKFVTAHGIFSL